jgi:outer membrane receptor protein involved in Fe transport
MQKNLPKERLKHAVKFKRKICTTAIIASSLLSSSILLSNTASAFKTPEMEEIIVSGSTPMSIMDLPRSATLITADDIETSGARSIPELLARQANISLKSLSGNSKFTSIDLRGSGDTSVSNILVLIDGVRVNAPDLSGADFSVLDLSQIERIEIIRGGNSVRYGSGASHGVINIITQATPAGIRGKIKTEAASYNSYSASGAISMANNDHSLALNASTADGNGFREHNRLKQRDFLIDYQGQLSDQWHVRIKSKAHRDKYQLPGHLGRAELEAGLAERSDGSIERGAEGNSQDDSQLLQLRWQASDALEITSNSNFRERKTQFVFGRDFYLVDTNARDHINQRSLHSELLFYWQPDNHWLSLSSGVEASRSDYLRTNSGQGFEGGERNGGKLDSHAYFLFGDINPTEALNFNLGYRRDKTNNRYQHGVIESDETSTECDTVFLPPPFETFSVKENCPLIINIDKASEQHWRNEAYEASAVYSFTAALNIFGSFSNTFRNPNVDELALSPPNLRPQTAERYEGGFKYAGDVVAVDIAYFHFRTTEEILFSLSTGSFGENVNADGNIERKGLELQSRIYITPSLELSSNFSYTDTQTDQQKRVLLVPFVTAASNLNWDPGNGINLNISARYTSERFDGNDTSNQQFDKLPSHTVVDSQFSYRHKLGNQQALRWFVGVRNLLNKRYSDIAYSNSVYPAAERNYFGGFSYDF